MWVLTPSWVLLGPIWGVCVCVPHFAGPAGFCDGKGGLELESEELGQILPWQRPCGSAQSLSERFFFRGVGVFWRFLALGTIFSLSGEGAGGCLQATVSVCPLCPLVCQPRDGSPWVRLTLGTGHPKDGSPWEWVTPGPMNLGDESRSPWRRVTLGMGHPREWSPQGWVTSGPTNPGDR